MAPPARMLAIVLAAAAPQSSHGIRQEAAAELLAAPLAQEGGDEPSFFAEQRQDSRASTADITPPGTASHHRRHHRHGADHWTDEEGKTCDPEAFPVKPKWDFSDKNGVQCFPGTRMFAVEHMEWLPYVYANESACTMRHFCVLFPEGERNELGQNCPQSLSGGSSASAMDDPHLVSLGGDRFDVRQPGRHSLLRVPVGDDPATERPLLALDADLQAPEGAPCGLYIRMVSLSGRWLDGKVVRIRPAGGGGGGAPWRPLSMQVVAASEAAPVAAADGPWAPFGAQEANKSLAEASTQQVQALAVRREELGPFSEGQAFKFELVGSASSSRQPPASITVSQSSHQALNVALAGMAGLGRARLGGLLGTEPHDRGLEAPTDECRESRAQGKGESLLLGVVNVPSDDAPSSSREQRVGGREEGSRMQAAWA